MGRSWGLELQLIILRGTGQPVTLRDLGQECLVS